MEKTSTGHWHLHGRNGVLIGAIDGNEAHGSSLGLLFHSGALSSLTGFLILQQPCQMLTLVFCHGYLVSLDSQHAVRMLATYQRNAMSGNQKRWLQAPSCVFGKTAQLPLVGRERGHRSLSSDASQVCRFACRWMMDAGQSFQSCGQCSVQPLRYAANGLMALPGSNRSNVSGGNRT